MKKMLLVGSILFSMVCFSGNAFAAGYGEAGCGLGSLVWQDGSKQKDPVFQILASTTNGTFGSQTFGITTGTSNCNDSIFKVEKEREVFAAINFSTLVKEMAMGEGDNLNTLASLYGCTETNFSDFGTVTQQNFGSIITSSETTHKDMLTNLNGVLAKDGNLTQSCTGIIG
ncbi:DUF3015 family protein [Nitrospina watsonii]|uniref:DUF3015 domain-containing protein n=1 Tax=Nitrospina watsonii TaxID=1323948 RepID=A0ABM9HFF5_9BACT|nr:DUF3015 family protein [Nitrospina watsonii]CAI2718959.1 conserved exported protein of unknown function [Nitrospina watsonii]